MNFNYEHSGTNKFLTYEVAPDQEIDTMCLGTLATQKIPGYAPVSFTQMDDTKYIRYNVTSKISVEELFGSTVSKKQMIALLKGIVEAMLATDEYLFLEQSAIVLDFRYIYIDPVTCETLVICLPLEYGQHEVVNVRGFLRSLLTEPSMEENDDQCLPPLLRFLNKSPNLVLSEFLGLLEQESMSEQPVVVPRDRAAANTADSEAQKQAEKKPAQGGAAGNDPRWDRPNGTGQTKVPGGSSRFVGLDDHFGKGGYGREDNKTPPAQTEGAKKGLFSNLFGGKKEDKSSAPQKVPQKGPQKMPQKREQMPEKPELSGQKPQGGLSTVNGRNIKIPRAPGSGNTPIPEMERRDDVRRSNGVGQPVVGGQSPVRSEPAKTEQKHTQSETAGAGFPGTVVLVSNSADTMLLDTSVKAYPYLVYLKTKEKISLNKEVFLIGKEREQVDYTIVGNNAVSRTHAKIMAKGKGYEIEDIDSTNGTFVNGKPIPSGVATRIEHGYRLTFANEEFEFKTH